MQQVLIVGAGGHAEVVADILLRMRDAGTCIRPIGYLDDDPEQQDRTPLGLPVLGTLSDLPSIPHDAVIVAIGNNQLRREIFFSLQAQGEVFATAIHPTASIAPDVHVGPGTQVCAGVIINPGVVIEANCIFSIGCAISHHTHIDAHAHVALGAHVGAQLKIGEGTLVGMSATIISRCNVGAWSVLGAAALVHKDVPGHVVVVGVPGRIVNHIKPCDHHIASRPFPFRLTGSHTRTNVQE